MLYEVITLLLHQLQRALPVGAPDVVFVRLLFESFQIAVDHRKRGSQLVGDVGDEVPAGAVQIVGGGDVAHHQQPLVALFAEAGHLHGENQRVVDRGDATSFGCWS